MKKYRIGILGATGAVGQEILKVLLEYEIPIEELRLFASKRSVGKKISFLGKDYEVMEPTMDSFHNLDFVFGASSNAVAKEFKEAIVSAKAIFIDNSSAFRMEHDVPLVIPEINGSDAFLHHGIIANPNCSTIITLMAIYAIEKLSPIKAMSVATYQATSGAGALGPLELKKQMEQLCKGTPLEIQVFPYQIVENVIPQIGNFLDNGYTTEEMKMQNEGRKILHRPDLRISCTCVRVPVERSHSIAVELVTKDELNLEQIRKAMLLEEGICLFDDIEKKKYPMPILTSNQDFVYVGRIRKSILHSNGIVLWCSGDQIRKGAASNAVQIMMKLIGLKD